MGLWDIDILPRMARLNKSRQATGIVHKHMFTHVNYSALIYHLSNRLVCSSIVLLWDGDNISHSYYYLSVYGNVMPILWWYCNGKLEYLSRSNSLCVKIFKSHDPVPHWTVIFLNHSVNTCSIFKVLMAHCQSLQ